MLKIASKFAMDIFPSVIATILGAYIVNHYINSKPEAPTAAAVLSPAPKKADLGNPPEPGVRAKGISEKSVIDKSAVEKAAVEKPVVDRPADKPAETASIPADTRRHPPNPREKEKTVAKTIPAQPVAPVVEPVLAAPNTAPSVEAAIAPDRDANDLARAAIERLRGTPDNSSRAQESVRLPDPPRVAAVPAAPSVQPLPPPILVSTPPAETFDAQTKPSYPATARADDPRRPTPPADIPDPKPLDLRADAIPPKPRTNVAEDVLSAAKSMFHSVLPHKEADQDSEAPNRF